MSQFALLKKRRFVPFFFTQFSAALNDNLYKNALTILLAYRELKWLSFDSAKLIALGTGLFILPFFLFSAVAGQVADKFAKHLLIRWVKGAEILIMILGTVALFTDQIPLLFFVLFLMGVHSAFFGPIKYSILPELLSREELVGGNALVEMGTFLAILVGTIVGGIFITTPHGPTIISTMIIAIAALGFFASIMLTPTPPTSPNLSLTANPFTPTIQIYRLVRQNRAVYLSILGISWFWGLGACFLTILPTYCKTALHADATTVTFFLVLFCVAIALGALACERLSRRQLELGLVPLGSIGMSLFAFDLFWASHIFEQHNTTAIIHGLSHFTPQFQFWRISLDFVGIAFFSGFYTVPLYTLIQERSPAEIRSRIIAGNNILNAAFMVGSSILLFCLPLLGAKAIHIFLILAIFNTLVAIYIYTLLPEFLFRFVCWMLSHVLYRVHVTGHEKIPLTGATILIANHVSFVDWLLISSISPRPVRFVMYHGFNKNPVLKHVFRDAKVIPIAPAHEDEGVLNAAFDQIAKELADGEMVCIFPEGKLTTHGKLNPFRTGIERIIQRTPVPVIPIAIKGMWGSFFSRKDKGFRNPFARLWSRTDLLVGETIPPDQVSAKFLEDRIVAMGIDR